MKQQSFIDEVSHAPVPFDENRARDTLADLSAAIDDSPYKTAAHSVLALHPVRDLLAGTAGNAPYLARLVARDGAWLLPLLDEPAAEIFARVMTELHDAIAAAGTLAEVMTAARIAKRRTALFTALADIGNVWELEDVTAALSDLADVTLTETVRWLLREAAAKGKITGIDEAEPDADSGLVILGMGKYGARELNYSSDIDIIVFYEAGRVAFAEGVEEQLFFVKLTRNLVKVMQELTADGYVYRTDLRLRPDAGATQVAISTEAALIYYEGMGQNWERAAMIKARPVAGDLAAGERFLKELSPFVWRKYLDFAAIEDVHSMKRQIHAFKGHGQITVAGHDIKLGRGGIREIEFFAQTQQLIAGGRDPDLRGRTTCGTLDMLAEKEWITPAAAEELKTAYHYLRTLEHRIQMLNDEQTHRLPKDEKGLEQMALFMGYEDFAGFDTHLRHVLETVQKHYAALFESAPPLSEEAGSLVFTGVEDDPETLETLEKLGFTQPSTVAASIRDWHRGHFAATRSPRSRERLTALIPSLLRALGDTEDPDVAFTRFHNFLTGLPAGVQLFSLLYSNPRMLGLLASIMGTAPKLAAYLSKNPGVLDAVISPDFFDPLPDRDVLKAELADALSRATHFEGFLDLTRIWTREQNFKVGVQVLSGTAAAEDAGAAFADIAAAVIEDIQPRVEEELAAAHGHAPGGLAVIAMGKLGGREMTAGSDLDLIFVYDAPEDGMSDGPKPLDAVRYYARLSQRLIGALTAPTAEGKLFDVDMRLRPSGRSGPLATKLATFADYQTHSAWTWEKMALTRARILTGPAALKGQIEAIIAEVLTAPKDAAKITADVLDMRARLDKEFGTKDPWSIKHVRGGLVDVEFIAQYLQLIHGEAHPEVLSTNTDDALVRMEAAGLIDTAQAARLLHASRLLHNIDQVQRLALEGNINPADATEGLKGLLAQAAGVETFTALEADLRDSEAAVFELFGKLIG